MWKILFLCLLLPSLLYAKTLRCDLCSRQIRGSYIASNGKNYCSQTCFEKTLPLCTSCRKRIKGEAFTYKNNLYCSLNCMKQAFPKCDICQKPIAGKYKIFETPDGKSRRLCIHCSQLSRCFACELPGRTARLPDGRYLCNDCASQRLHSRAETEELFNEIRTRMEKMLGEKIDCKLKFYTVDYPTLVKLSNLKTFSDTDIELGFCQARMATRKTGNRTEVVKYDCTVYMLDNLPRGRFIDIAAHELAHHWQYHKYPFLKRDPLKIPEGFAEYISSRVNELYGQPEYNRKKEARRDFIYGAGYKMYRKIAGNRGLPAVFEYLKQNSDQ